MKTSTLTVQERFEAAINEATENGLQFVGNHEGDESCQCCSDIADYIDDLKAPYAWNSVWVAGYEFDIEGDARIFQTYMDTEQEWLGWDDEVEEDMYEETEVQDVEYFNWTNTMSFNHGNGGAELFVAALRNHGFTVEWNGSTASTVDVTFA